MFWLHEAKTPAFDSPPTSVFLCLCVVSKMASIISKSQVWARHFHRLVLLKALVRARNNALLLRKIHGVPATSLLLIIGTIIKNWIDNRNANSLITDLSDWDISNIKLDNTNNL